MAGATTTTTTTTTTAPTPTRPARPPLHQLLCPLTRYGPRRRKTKPQAQPPPNPPPSAAAAYPGDTMCVAVTADERVVSVEQFDCPAHDHQEQRQDARNAGGWVKVAAGDGEAGEEWFDVIALGEEEGGESSRGGGGGGGAGKMLLKDSEVERVMREVERDVEVFVEVVRAQGRRVGRWAGVVGLCGWGWGLGDGKKEGGGEEVVVVKGRWGP
ncbi:hypothetical protein DFP73DRAFT_595794 [Morchella snyderi]|nr:hypothetical protein DFP73DRAFT_595794 [Morchella snyderi]